MSTWRVRPEGASEPGPPLTLQEVAEGLQERLWEPTDEVMGPTDTEWTTFENHPAFAEAVAELIDPVPERPDDTRLDMNPLIDVCLVLLIFFILTTTYETLRRAIDVPSMAQDEEKGSTKAPPKPPDWKELKEFVFVVTARMEDGKPVVRVENKVVPEADLVQALTDVVKQTGKKQILLDADLEVPWRTYTAILDASKGAEITTVMPLKRKAAKE